MEKKKIRLYIPLNFAVDPDENKDWSQINGFKDFFDYTGSPYSSVFTDSTQTAKLMKKYIFPKYRRAPISYIDVDDGTSDESIATLSLIEYDEWLGRLYTWLNETQENYEYLIQIQEGNLLSLMSDVESTDQVKFNDTPQTTSSGLDGDSFLSTVTTTSHKSQVATKMARIQEIKQNLKSIYKEWADSFKTDLLMYSHEI